LFALLEVGEPDLDERRDLCLDPRLAGELERALPALPRLCGVPTLLQAVVTLDNRLLDMNTLVTVHFPHPT
jgi:hypothetical protein